jgi:regulator of protease activity HflC (stomatin/prohibitin superfamily)
MGDFLRVILDSIQYLWPFRLVKPWERGGYYVFGRFWRVVPPGVFPVIPWFTEVMTISVVPAIVETTRQDITLQDGKTVLSFAASAVVQVVDFNLAVNTIDNFHQTTQELIRAVLAEKLAQVDAERLAPEKRGRLLADLRRWIDEEARTFGVEVQKLRFPTFILNARTYRLLQDTQSNPW